MKISLINGVILAEDYDRLIDWYVTIFSLDIEHRVTKGYHYTELAQQGHVIFGIAKTEEMGIIPTNPRNNSVIIQVTVSDIQEIFDRIKGAGKILFGPTRDRDSGFIYGGITDPEGNQIWIVERKVNDR